MKSVYLLLVALVACTFTLTTVSGTVYAASAQNAVTETTSTNAKKQVPREVNINTADKELLTQLDGSLFWQIHRSTLVNVKAIADITRDFRGRQIVTVKGHGEKLEVSRSYTHLFKGM